MAIDPRSPVVQAEQARQVVGVLTWIERRYADGAWTRGTRFGSGGGMCLIGGIDEATGWTVEGVAEQATHELALRLPAPLRLLARFRPRMALALYNDLVGGRHGARWLVQRTRFELGGVNRPTPVFVNAPTDMEAAAAVPAAR